MPASIFNGPAVKILKDILKYKDGTEISSTKAANITEGPASSTNNNLPLFDGTTGKLLKESNQSLGTLDTTPTNYTASTGTEIASHFTGIDTKLGSLESLITNFEWQESALDYITDNTAAPPTEVLGDRYILSHDGGAPNAAWDGASAGDIVEFNGTTWDAVTPTTGMMISVDDETTSLRQWGGSSWDQKFFESTTASGFLSKSGFDIQLTNLSNQNLIIGNGSNVATAVNTNSVGDVEADTTNGLLVKSGVLDNDNINASAAIDATKIHDGSVDNTEFGYLNGVTSAIQTQIDGKVDGPASSTDNTIARYDGTTGKLIQASNVVIDNSDQVSGMTRLDVDEIRLNGSTISTLSTNQNLTVNPNGTGNVSIQANLLMNANRITSLADPAANKDAIHREYFENNIFCVSSNSGTFNAVNYETHLVDTSGGISTITLPPPTANKFVRIKDKGNANTNNITINPNAAENIDGAASFVINSDYGSAIFVSDGTDWFIL